MSNGTNGSGRTMHLGNSGGSAGPTPAGNFAGKKNPFKEFKTYQKEFAAANDLPTLKKVLEDNGVQMSDKFEKYITEGKYPIERAKDFMKGTLLTMSHFGDGEKFIGFGAYKRTNSSTVAYYAHPTVVGSQANGYIAVNIGHPSSRSKSIYGTGAHEAYHQVEGLMGDRKGISYKKYSQDVVTQVYTKWSGNKANNSSGNVKTDFAKHISPYGATSNVEALSEAMKNVITKKARASSLSKGIYKAVRSDAEKYKPFIK